MYAYSFKHFFMKRFNWERNVNFNHAGLPVMKVAITLLLMYSSRFSLQLVTYVGSTQAYW